MSHSTFPITQFLPQNRIIICKVECDISLKEKLSSMGIEEGVEVSILNVSKKNALVIVKRENRRVVLRCNKNLIILGKQI